MQLNTYLKLSRKNKVLSQKEVAQKADIAPQYYHDIENGRRIPGDDVLTKLAQVLEFDLDFAFYLIEKYPLDLRGNKTKPKVVKAFKVMRSND